MRLKKLYSSREVASLTGLSARQLQWWDSKRLFTSAVASQRTEAGGYTERRYTPLDVLELQALADLRQRGFSIPRLRHLLDTLRDVFHIRLYEAIGRRTDDAVRRRRSDLRAGAGRPADQPRRSDAAAADGGGGIALAAGDGQGAPAQAAGAAVSRAAARPKGGQLDTARYLLDRENLREVVGRTGNDVNADQLAHAAGRGGPSVGGSLHRPDIAADDRGDQPGIHLLPAHENHVGRLEHGVGRLDHADQAARLDHAEGVADGRFIVRHW